MDKFLGSLPKTERSELFDFLHHCRYLCKRGGQGSLGKNLSALLRVVEISASRLQDTPAVAGEALLGIVDAAAKPRRTRVN
jgi:hypothetical protein